MNDRELLIKVAEELRSAKHKTKVLEAQKDWLVNELVSEKNASEYEKLASRLIESGAVAAEEKDSVMQKLANIKDLGSFAAALEFINAKADDTKIAHVDTAAPENSSEYMLNDIYAYLESI
jgi:hypothetical protein